ncbi:MAG: CAAX amino terminal protease family protein [uncultured Rubrobacteraceae bacterium]|uniref:CAAX amino terminal protease family protein n=1 Tax=uncultured Rubrobacteraceae bacterium TaxID=349277 RepID=A0A6J4Q6T0_9ACTN|nr:MAG: CAAX amino terminal protease family protein [uncultured Rubrobacteraceae bacterium]
MLASRESQTVAFFVLAFGISWSLWVPAAFGNSPSLLLLVFLGSFGPSLAAVLLKALSEGKHGLKGLLGRLLGWRLALRWYLVVLLGPLGVALTATVLDGLLGGAGPGLGGPQIPEGLSTGLILLGLLPAFLISLIFGGPLGEEIGWRGYALPRLQEGWSPLASALILGVIWGLWHLPLFFISGTTQSFLSFVPFILWVVGLSVLFTWIYNSTDGNLLIAILLHASVNFFAATLTVFPASETDYARPFLLYTLLVCLLATAVVLIAGSRLSRNPRIQ